MNATYYTKSFQPFDRWEVPRERTGYQAESAEFTTTSLAPSVRKGKLIPTTNMERTTKNHRAKTPEGHVEDTAISAN